MADCPTCGESFDAPSNMKRHHALSHGESIAGFPTECANCGDAIIKRVEEHTEGNSFCDQRCLGEYNSEHRTGKDALRWQGGDVSLDCEYCGDEFSTNPADASRRRYCSRHCRGKDLVGEQNPNWRGGYEDYYGSNWIEMRNRVRERDNNICQVCGSEGSRWWPVHHIKPVGDFEDKEDAHTMDNMFQACLECHPTVETLSAAEQQTYVNL